jgi:glutathione S-transferase
VNALGLTALQRKPVTFARTSPLVRAAARNRLRSQRRWVDADTAGRWQREWRLVSSVMLGWLLNGDEISPVDLYAAALVMRLARWEYGEEHGVHAHRRAAARQAVSR